MYCRYKKLISLSYILQYNMAVSVYNPENRLTQTGQFYLVLK